MRVQYMKISRWNDNLMRRFNHIVFWVFIFVLLTLVFGSLYDNFIEAFYFVAMLLPVIVGTSYFFSYHLVPRFLLQKKIFKFILYSLYMLIISLYLEMVVITLSFIFIADYQSSKQIPIAVNVIVLAISLYCVVFLYSFILLIRYSLMHQKKIQIMTEEQEKQKEDFLLVRADRKINKIHRDDIIYLESLGDYVRINTSSSAPIMTKEKISKLSAGLPESFLRIHRSYVVNVRKIDAYTREQVQINSTSLPISRTYRKNVMESLSR